MNTKLDPESRLATWQQLRHSIEDVDFNTALLKTYEFWENVPTTPYYLDYDSIEKWPDPWQLIAENYYCDLAKCLGMLYTIYLSGHKESDPEIRVYRDKNSLYLYSVLWLYNGKYILNWSQEEIVNTQQLEETEPVLLHRYTNKDLNLERY